jgi:hypothetical protein
MVAVAPSAIVVSYELPARGGMTAALEALCARGARGDVILAGERFIVGGAVRRVDAEAAAALESSGCRVQRANIPLHMKLAFIGTGDAYLSDRNFGRYATVLHVDAPADRSLIAQTLQNRPGSNGTLATLKGEALAIEAATIASSHGSLDFESESFGPNTPVYDALVAAAQTGRAIRVIVSASDLAEDSGSEAAALRNLAALHVQIATGRSDAKIAVSDSSLFIGSANATAGYPEQIDWGRRIDDAPTRTEIRRRFQHDWEEAQPWSP